MIGTYRVKSFLASGAETAKATMEPSTLLSHTKEYSGQRVRYAPTTLSPTSSRSAGHRPGKAEIIPRSRKVHHFIF